MSWYTYIYTYTTLDTHWSERPPYLLKFTRWTYNLFSEAAPNWLTACVKSINSTVRQIGKTSKENEDNTKQYSTDLYTQPNDSS